MNHTFSHEPGWKTRFFFIWSGQAASIFGTAVTQFVLIWWVTSTTRSAAALTVASLAALIPMAVFGPIGGVVADRWNRKAIMMITDAISAICVAVLIVLFSMGAMQLWHAFTMMAIRSVMTAFQQPAAMSSTTFLVPDNWLERASGLNQLVVSISAIAAAPVGAVVMSVLPLQWALAIDVLTALTAVLIVSFFKIPQPPRVRNGKGQEPRPGFFHELTLGAKTVLKNRGIRNLFGVLALATAMFMPAMSLLPLLIVKDFNGTATHVAIFEAFSGVGMTIGSLVVVAARFPKRVMPLVLVLVAVSCGLITVLGIVPSTAFWLLVAVWWLSSVLWMIGNGPIMATLQRTIEPVFQGRVISLYVTLTGFAGPVGLAIFGFFSESIGVRAVLILTGILSMAACFLGLFSPAVRSLGAGRNAGNGNGSDSPSAPD